MTAARVTVVGAGVIGLGCAVALQEAGHDVTVVAPDGPTTSGVAGGLWMPYATGTDVRVARWAGETRAALVAAGHPEVDYVHLQRDRPAWLDLVPQVREATIAELRGRPAGWVARVPLVELPRHLATLAAALRRPVVRAAVADLHALGHTEPPPRHAAPDVAAEKPPWPRFLPPGPPGDDPGGVCGAADVVVNAAGLAGGALAGDDDTVVPVRGQVVHVRAPAGTPCVADEDELTYVLPRADVCVVGGTHQPADADTAPREAETADILARARALVPELEGAAVLGAAAGLRPARLAGPRVQRVGDVVHCYGHGGAGLTLSLGCAAEVVRLVEAA